MTESNDTVYETNFETSRVKEIRINYYGNPYPSSIDYPLEEKLAEVKRLSIIPIRNASDIYHALTNRETLDKILEQGLDEEHQKYKNKLVNFFMGIKDKIRIGDLFITSTLYDYSNNNRQQYAKCSLCQAFANIHCVNCNFIVLTVMMSGYVLNIGDSMKQMYMIVGFNVFFKAISSGNLKGVIPKIAV